MGEASEASQLRPLAAAAARAERPHRPSHGASVSRHLLLALQIYRITNSLDSANRLGHCGPVLCGFGSEASPPQSMLPSQGAGRAMCMHGIHHRPCRYLPVSNMQTISCRDFEVFSFLVDVFARDVALAQSRWHDCYNGHGHRPPGCRAHT